MTTTHNLVSSQQDPIYYRQSTPLPTLTYHFLSPFAISHLSNFLYGRLISLLLCFIQAMWITSFITHELLWWIISVPLMADIVISFIRDIHMRDNVLKRVKMVLDILSMTPQLCSGSSSSRILLLCNMQCLIKIISFRKVGLMWILCR